MNAIKRYNMAKKDFCTCMLHVEKARKGYDYWQYKKGIVAFISKKVFALYESVITKCAEANLKILLTYGDMIKYETERES